MDASAADVKVDMSKQEHHYHAAADASQHGTVNPGFDAQPPQQLPVLTYPGDHATPYSPPGGPVAIIRQPPAPPAKTYVGASILVCLFCCWPIGLVAMAYAVKTHKANERGDSINAQAASTKARHATLAGFGCGIILIAIVIMVILVG